MNNWRSNMIHGLMATQDCGEYKVRRYANRLAIWRKDGARMTWEELQIVKTQIWGDCIAIEIYPKQSDVVNLRHTRHLWRSDAITEIVSMQCVHPEFQVGPEKPIITNNTEDF